jgi:hypothetical protein
MGEINEQLLRELSCYARSGGFQDADIEDLLSETMLSIFQKYPKILASGINLRPLLYRILKSKMNEKVRERRPLSLLSAPEAAEIEDSCDDTGQPNGHEVEEWLDAVFGPEDNPRPAFLRGVMENLKKERDKLGGRGEAFIKGRNADSKAGRHFDRRTLQLIKQWAAKKEKKPGDGTFEIQQKIEKAFEDFWNLEILTLGVPFNWVVPTIDELPHWYQYYYGSSPKAGFHHKFGTFFCEALLGKAALECPVKVTYMTEAEKYWSICSNRVREFNQRVARDWEFELRDDPQGLRFLRDTGFDTIAIFFAGRQESKNVLFVVRRNFLQSIDVLSPIAGAKWVNDLANIRKISAEVRLK